MLARRWKLVTHHRHFSDQKHTFPPGHKAGHLVSVLDLDNSVRFSWQTDGRSRKQSRQMLALGPRASSTRLRCTAYARAPNSVDLYLSIRCQCHVLPPCGDLRTLRLKNRRSNSVSLLEDAFFCLRCALVGGATTNSLENWCKTNLGDANLSVAKIGGA